jgi:glycosyltransferase involved in cell wall biosynthesis
MRIHPENPIRLMTMTTSHETIGGFFEKQLGVMTENGFEVHAVSSPGERLEKLKRVPGVSTHGIPIERAPHPSRDLLSLWNIFQLIRRVRPHIVHAHTPKAGLLGMAAAKAARLPIRLYTIHGLPLLTRRGPWRRVLESAERTSCALSTRSYTVSPSLHRLVLEMKLCRKEKLVTLGDGSCAGIDLEQFNAGADLTARSAAVRSAYGIPREARLLTFIGRISKDKGIAILADAWTKLATEFQDLHLLIAGPYDPTDPVPESALDVLRNHGRVHMMGRWVEDIPPIYAATTVCVLPTFREGLSQVALEAGAMGIPTVGTCIPGLVDSIRDGVTGLLAPAADAAGFAEAVRRVLSSEALRESLGRAAREHVRIRFSDQRVNQLWLSEYQNLVRATQSEFFKSPEPSAL